MYRFLFILQCNFAKIPSYTAVNVGSLAVTLPLRWCYERSISLFSSQLNF